MVAIASRTLASAQTAAKALGIARAYGSYEELLADAAVEVIYNPLPNHLHVPLTLAAVHAGKPVLCEKPMAISAAELDLLRPFATQVHIAEALMVRHHPQWSEVRNLVRGGAIGELRFMQLPFSYYNVEADNIRNRADIGGGALYDIGCYAIAAGRWFFEADPQRAIAGIDRDPAFKTDSLASGVLDFGAARQFVFTVSTQTARYQHIHLVGTQGRIEIETLFNAPQDAPVRYHVDNNNPLDGRGVRTVLVPAAAAAADPYQLQGDAFSQAVRKLPPTAAALDDAAMKLRVIEVLFASEESGQFERV